MHDAQTPGNRAQHSCPQKQTRREGKHDTRTRDQNTGTGTRPQHKHRNNDAREHNWSANRNHDAGHANTGNENRTGKKRFSKAGEKGKRRRTMNWKDRKKQPRTTNLKTQRTKEVEGQWEQNANAKQAPATKPTIYKKWQAHAAFLRPMKPQNEVTKEASVSRRTIPKRWRMRSGGRACEHKK
ncbi:hypothetical protein ARMGADRAFT_1085172 [Armillaria gallica]|uniref:Uncharacterized protein n=1 Tax=Armillaria gallica TaxID=47427 RepID=A0A2H3DFH3_ARMGA|nr:hypothetical protein ARMGADRAFT_1085172 [Armillaria gallica]